MKRNSYLTFIAAFMLAFLSSCDIIGGIFKAGVWVGVIIVVLIVLVIVAIMKRTRKD